VNKNPSCNPLRKFEFLLQLRNLSLSLYKWPWGFWNWVRFLECAEADIRLSVDTAFNEKRAVAAGQIILRLIAFVLWEYSEGKDDIFSECFFHDTFSGTNKLSVVKLSNLHDALSSYPSCLFVAVKNLEHPHASFN